MSATSTPATASNNEIEEKPAPTLAEVVRKLDTENLIEFLREEEDLQLNDAFFEILHNEEITRRTFLKLTKEEFMQDGFKRGPATALVEFVKEVKEKKLMVFSSYCSLKEVLAKYGMESEGIDVILLFSLSTYKIQDGDLHFKHCMAEILVRLKNYRPLHEDCLEAMRNEYVVAILHSALNIARKDTEKEFSMCSQQEVIGEESSGRDAEDLICITEDKQHKVPMGFTQNIKQLESSFETNKRKRKWDEAFDDDFDYLYGIVTTGRDWHFLLYSPGEISKGSKMPLSIEFTDDALEEDSNEYQALYNGVKRVLGAVVGLLKDRACVKKSPSSKQARIEGYRTKK
ncbi:14845_t:CDS:2 [Cetraspora pellucida]|uniref:14845_t:CDS:1 n=1 Tax=Cetraspora pellucida TaxID=1433469 RepID=A0ACA9LL16_9GLOM|nr:14845_t:CDS:2 [Cetraspora pellucida]